MAAWVTPPGRVAGRVGDLHPLQVEPVPRRRDRPLDVAALVLVPRPGQREVVVQAGARRRRGTADDGGQHDERRPRGAVGPAVDLAAAQRAVHRREVGLALHRRRLRDGDQREARETAITTSTIHHSVEKIASSTAVAIHTPEATYAMRSVVENSHRRTRATARTHVATPERHDQEPDHRLGRDLHHARGLVGAADQVVAADQGGVAVDRVGHAEAHQREAAVPERDGDDDVGRPTGVALVHEAAAAALLGGGVDDAGRDRQQHEGERREPQDAHLQRQLEHEVGDVVAGVGAAEVDGVRGRQVGVALLQHRRAEHQRGDGGEHRPDAPHRPAHERQAAAVAVRHGRDAQGRDQQRDAEHHEHDAPYRGTGCARSRRAGGRRSPCRACRRTPAGS